MARARLVLAPLLALAAIGASSPPAPAAGPAPATLLGFSA